MHRTAFGVSLSTMRDGKPRKSLDAAQDAATLLGNVAETHSTATSTLQRIRNIDADPGLEAWRPDRETAEQEAIREILYEMKPTFEGLRAMVMGVTQGGRAAALTDKGNYSEAMHFATSARANMDFATTHFQRALDRNVRYYGEIVTVLECQASGFYEVLATLVDAIQAYQEGQKEEGADLLAEYRSGATRATEECQAPTGTESG